MITKNDVLEIIYEAIDELNLYNGSFIPKEEHTVLFGVSSEIDSLDFVSLIVDIEKRIEDKYGLVLSLTTEKAMSRQNSPFKAISSLTDYILTLVNESNINNGGE